MVSAQNIWDTLGRGWEIINFGPAYHGPAGQFIDALLLFAILFGFVWSLAKGKFGGAKLPGVVAAGAALIVWAPIVLWLYRSGRLLFQSVVPAVAGMIITAAIFFIILNNFRIAWGGKRNVWWKASMLFGAIAIAGLIFGPIIFASEAPTPGEQKVKQTASDVTKASMPLALILALIAGFAGGFASGGTLGFKAGGSGGADNRFNRNQGKDIDEEVAGLRSAMQKQSMDDRLDEFLANTSAAHERVVQETAQHEGQLGLSKLAAYLQGVAENLNQVSGRVKDYRAWMERTQARLPEQHMNRLRALAASWASTLNKVHERLQQSAAQIQEDDLREHQLEEKDLDALRKAEQEVATEEELLSIEEKLNEQLFVEDSEYLKHAERLEHHVDKNASEGFVQFSQMNDRLLEREQRELVTRMQTLRADLESLHPLTRELRDVRKDLSHLTEDIPHLEKEQHEAIRSAQQRLNQADTEIQECAQSLVPGLQEADPSKAAAAHEHASNAAQQVQKAQKANSKAVAQTTKLLESLERLHARAERLPAIREELSRLEALNEESVAVAAVAEQLGIFYEEMRSAETHFSQGDTQEKLEKTESYINELVENAVKRLRAAQEKLTSEYPSAGEHIQRAVAIGMRVQQKFIEDVRELEQSAKRNASKGEQRLSALEEVPK